LRRIEPFIWFLLLAALIAGCEAAGYKDEAYKKQAARSLQRISAALEQYRAEYKTYPPGHSDLGEVLSEYFVATDTAGNVTNELPRMMETSFWGDIVYETPDSVYSYIILAKALDTRHTPVTVRSNLKPEVKKTKKKR
jgi:type II secretory pathway pseudopilin PulG